MNDLSPFEPSVLGAMWKYKWLALLIVAVVTAVAIGYAVYSPVSYQATSTLVVEDPRASSLFDIGSVQRPERYVADQAVILASPVVAERAAATEELLEDAEAVLIGIKVIQDRESNLIQVVYTADDPETAIAGANAVAAAYVDVRREATSGSFSAALVQIDDSIADVEVRLSELQSLIDDEIEVDAVRVELDDQLNIALLRLATLQEELRDATDTDLDDLRGERDDILQQIQTLQTLGDLDVQNPRLAALREEQRQTISRKAALLQRKDELSVEARMESTGVVLASPAISAEEMGANLARTAAVGLVFGVLLAAGVTYLLALQKRIFSDRTHPELVLHVPLLAEVPHFREERIKGELPVKSQPASVSAEAFRFIAAALDVEAEYGLGDDSDAAHVASDADSLVRSVVVVSPSLGDGKTVIAANTALASARQGKRVLAVDADFGHQKLSALLAGENQPDKGLTELVQRGVPLHRVAYQVPLKDGAHLDLVARGRVDITAADFFRSAGVRAFFEAVKEEYDLVVIDTPPLLHVAYASPLVRSADRTIVVMTHRENVAPAEDLSDRLTFLDAHVMGYVYNKAPLRDDMTRSEGSLEDVLGQRLTLPSIG